MVSQPIITATEDLKDLNERLLNLLSRSDKGFDVTQSEKELLLNVTLGAMAAERGFSLFVFGFGDEPKDWDNEDMQLRFDLLLIARDLATQKDVSWVASLLGMSAEMSVELVSATKKRLRELAACSSPWRTRFPESIFHGMTAQHDPGFLSARMMLSGC